MSDISNHSLNILKVIVITIIVPLQTPISVSKLFTAGIPNIADPDIVPNSDSIPESNIYTKSEINATIIVTKNIIIAIVIN